MMMTFVFCRATMAMMRITGSIQGGQRRRNVPILQLSCLFYLLSSVSSGFIQPYLRRPSYFLPRRAATAAIERPRTDVLATRQSEEGRSHYLTTPGGGYVFQQPPGGTRNAANYDMRYNDNARWKDGHALQPDDFLNAPRSAPDRPPAAPLSRVQSSPTYATSARLSAGVDGYHPAHGSRGRSQSGSDWLISRGDSPATRALTFPSLPPQSPLNTGFTYSAGQNNGIVNQQPPRGKPGSKGVGYIYSLGTKSETKDWSSYSPPAPFTPLSTAPAPASADYLGALSSGPVQRQFPRRGRVQTGGTGGNYLDNIANTVVSPDWSRLAAPRPFSTLTASPAAPAPSSAWSRPAARVDYVGGMNMQGRQLPRRGQGYSAAAGGTGYLDNMNMQRPVETPDWSQFKAPATYNPPSNTAAQGRPGRGAPGSGSMGTGYDDSRVRTRATTERSRMTASAPYAPPLSRSATVSTQTAGATMADPARRQPVKGEPNSVTRRTTSAVSMSAYAASKGWPTGSSPTTYASPPPTRVPPMGPSSRSTRAESWESSDYRSSSGGRSVMDDVLRSTSNTATPRKGYFDKMGTLFGNLFGGGSSARGNAGLGSVGSWNPARKAPKPRRRPKASRKTIGTGSTYLKNMKKPRAAVDWSEYTANSNRGSGSVSSNSRYPMTDSNPTRGRTNSRVGESYMGNSVSRKPARSPPRSSGMPWASRKTIGSGSTYLDNMKKPRAAIDWSTYSGRSDFDSPTASRTTGRYRGSRTTTEGGRSYLDSMKRSRAPTDWSQFKGRNLRDSTRDSGSGMSPSSRERSMDTPPSTIRRSSFLDDLRGGAVTKQRVLPSNAEKNPPRRPTRGDGGFRDTAGLDARNAGGDLVRHRPIRGELKHATGRTTSTSSMSAYATSRGWSSGTAVTSNTPQATILSASNGVSAQATSRTESEEAVNYASPSESTRRENLPLTSMSNVRSVKKEPFLAISEVFGNMLGGGSATTGRIGSSRSASSFRKVGSSASARKAPRTRGKPKASRKTIGSGSTYLTSMKKPRVAKNWSTTIGRRDTASVDASKSPPIGSVVPQVSPPPLPSRSASTQRTSRNLPAPPRVAAARRETPVLPTGPRKRISERPVLPQRNVEENKTKPPRRSVASVDLSLPNPAASTVMPATTSRRGEDAASPRIQAGSRSDSKRGDIAGDTVAEKTGAPTKSPDGTATKALTPAFEVSRPTNSPPASPPATKLVNRDRKSVQTPKAGTTTRSSKRLSPGFKKISSTPIVQRGNDDNSSKVSSGVSMKDSERIWNSSSKAPRPPAASIPANLPKNPVQSPVVGSTPPSVTRGLQKVNSSKPIQAEEDVKRNRIIRIEDMEEKKRIPTVESFFFADIEEAAIPETTIQDPAQESTPAQVPITEQKSIETSTSTAIAGGWNQKSGKSVEDTTANRDILEVNPQHDFGQGILSQAEIMVGRVFMVLLTTGLLIELLTTETFPQQLEEVLRVTNTISVQTTETVDQAVEQVRQPFAPRLQEFLRATDAIVDKTTGSVDRIIEQTKISGPPPVALRAMDAIVDRTSESVNRIVAQTKESIPPPSASDALRAIDAIVDRTTESVNRIVGQTKESIPPPSASDALRAIDAIVDRTTDSVNRILEQTKESLPSPATPDAVRTMDAAIDRTAESVNRIVEQTKKSLPLPVAPDNPRATDAIVDRTAESANRIVEQTKASLPTPATPDALRAADAIGDETTASIDRIVEQIKESFPSPAAPDALQTKESSFSSAPVAPGADDFNF